MPSHQSSSHRALRWVGRCSLLFLALGLLLGSWVMWGSWPNPSPEPLPWQPDVVVVLGGGDKERGHQAIQLARHYPKVPIIVTGDGGVLYRQMVEAGVADSRITHESMATSTLENARFTAESLTDMKAEQVALVTDGFHAPRALAIFSREHPDLEFRAVFAPRSPNPGDWYTYSERRERLAALHNLFFHGIWSF